MDENDGVEVLDETGETTSGTCGEDLTWVLTSDGTLTISGTGAMNDLDDSDQKPWGDTIRKVVINDGVTSIGRGVFYSCKELTEVTFPESVTSIGSYAFTSCSSLTEITLPSGVTSIGGNAFSDTGLKEIVIPSSMTSIGNAFSYCNLTKVTIPSSVTQIEGGAFAYCAKLTKVTIPSSVTSLGEGAFLHCVGLEEMYFEGDKPEFQDTIFCSCGGMTATIYYPAGNDTWADAIGQSYGAASLTWIAYGEEAPDTITTSSTDEAISGLTTSNVILTLPNGTEVDEAVQETLFEKAAEYDRTLEFDFYDGEDLTYSWAFDGSTITDPTKTVRFQIIIDANNDEVTSLVEEGANQIDYRFLHEDVLPGPVELKLDTKNMVSAGDLYLYYYNPETKALELISSDVQMEGKYAIFTLAHCSDYILSNKFIRSLIPETAAPTTAPQTEALVPQTPAANVDSTDGSDTGDTTPIAPLAVSLFGAMTAMGAILYVKQRKR